MSCNCGSDGCSRTARYAEPGAVQRAIDSGRRTYVHGDRTIAEVVACERQILDDWWEAHRDQAWRDILGVERHERVIDVTVTADLSAFNSAMRAAGAAASKLAWLWVGNSYAEREGVAR